MAGLLPLPREVDLEGVMVVGSQYLFAAASAALPSLRLAQTALFGDSIQLTWPISKIMIKNTKNVITAPLGRAHSPAQTLEIYAASHTPTPT